ncbi:hypothetical protein TSOC_008495 [Tetrabaena socialis]|uniref:DUF3783 domain-containing protein n=1 Tax=Tetrabaena socialis TaxID=47790 RepID=A0A2J7ZYB8_9CHLO|nr:hypothetical protein TSOC_008495 [Tetrabaena socialis]|eukprot:PNH05255.1 hypothetical protein TSOC_008495 [Tetrabaena socialis]
MQSQALARGTAGGQRAAVSTRLHGRVHPPCPRRSGPAPSCPPHPPARRRVQARIFDGLKNLFPGGSKPPQPQQQQSQGEQGRPGEDEDEENEGTEMQRLDAESGGLGEDKSAFGPLAVLLVGFQAEEVEAFRRVMIEMEADMVKLVPCSPAMMAGTLQQALESEFPKYEQPPLGTRRMAFLSGMFGSELVEVIGAYKDAGLPPTVWAAAVPNNYERIVADLAEEVFSDNAAMVRRAQEEQARRALEEQQ